MRSIKRTLICSVIALAALFSTPVKAEGPFGSLSFEFSIDVVTNYVWRGQQLNSAAVVQPSFTVAGERWSANWWGNYDLVDRDSDFTEFDWTFDYSVMDTDALSVNAGAIFYYFPSVGKTTEVYMAFAFNQVPLVPTLTVYWDIDDAGGVYANLAVGHEIVLANESASLNLGADIGWGSAGFNKYYHGTGSGINDLNLSASFDFALSESTSMSLYVKYYKLMDEAGNAWHDPDGVYGGVNFTVSF